MTAWPSGSFSVRENLILDLYKDDKFSRGLALRLDEIKQNADDRIEEFDIRTESASTPVESLSGGNQQKVVVGRWLLGDTKLLLLDEPTRGVDVGARAELYQVIHNLAAGGVGVLLVSSEVPEVLGLAGRVLVMREGRLIHESPAADIDEDTVLDLVMAGSLMEGEPT